MTKDISRRLDGTVRERRILEAVQPIFADPLPWRLSDSRNGDGAAVASEIDIQKSAEINIDKAAAFFFDDMVSVGVQLRDLPDHDLSAHSFQCCVDTITKLLLFLEDLVEDDILSHPLVQAGDQDQHQKDTFNADETPTPPPADKGRGSNFLLSWIRDTFGPLADVVTKAPLPQSSPDSLIPPTTNVQLETHPYEKLEAMERILAESSTSDEALGAVCRGFVKLEHTLESFFSGTIKASYVNGSLKGIIDDVGEASLQPPAQKQVAPTRWQDRMPWELSNQLFRILEKRICSDQDHEAKLQLAGFKLDECCDSSLTLDMFVSSCSTPTKFWQECRCTSVTKNPLNARTASILNDSVCRSIYKFKSRRTWPSLFNIKFDDDDYLWHPSKTDERSGYGGALPTMTLEELIERGYLREKIDDSVPFNMDDKAVLALSLARCLLHLWQGLWLKEPWQAESIQFISDPDKVLDIHRPYITCLLKKPRSGDPPASTPDEFQPTLLAFARLLLEIETGTRIPAEPPLPSPEEVEAAIDLVLKQRAKRHGRRDYNNAVAGCFHVKAILKRQEREGFDSGGDRIHRMRKTLYEAIVQHLESNFNQIQDQDEALKLRILYLYQCAANSICLDPRREDSGTELKLSDSEDGQLLSQDDDQDTTEARRRKTDKWFQTFQKLLVKYDIGRLPPEKRLKVAILDSGINYAHPDFSAEDRDRIKERVTFIGGNPDIDLTGHGTHIAAIVLRLTKNVDLYIGKITESQSVNQRMEIAKAISHARTDSKWKVHMISLSFGFEEVQAPDKIGEEITQCLNDGIMVFASASNDGGGGSRTYPAKYGRVICVHSATWQGVASTSNPGREEGLDNFSAVGEHVRPIWPSKVSKQKAGMDYRRGTSFATPVAVSIAAFMIGYIRTRWPGHPWIIQPWSPDGMTRIFQLMKIKIGDYDWVCPIRYIKYTKLEKIEGDLKQYLG